MKSKKIVGYLLKLVGILLPLYAFSALSMESIKEDIAFADFKKVISAEISDDGADTSEPEPDTASEEAVAIESYNQNIHTSGIIDPFDAGTYTSAYRLSGYEEGDIFAYLAIPKLDMVKEIRLGANNANLAKGLAHIDGTALPVGGVGNRSVIAGHRGTYKDLLFLNLDELVAGDRIYVKYQDEILEYKVYDKEVIKPYEWEKLDPVAGEDILTLLTCEPFAPPRPYRLLVHCKRVEESAEKQEGYQHTDTSSAVASGMDMTDDTESISVSRGDSSVRISSFVRWLKFGIYGITLVLWMVFIYVLQKAWREIKG